MTGGRRKVGFALAVIVVLSSFGYLVYGGIGENLVFFHTPGELLAKGAQAYDKPYRLGGQVVPGTMTWNADAVDLRFTMQDVDGQIVVHSTKAPPAMFREGQGVVVEGKLNRDGVFEASTVMVKHSNEYRPPADGHPRPEDTYRSLIRES